MIKHRPVCYATLRYLSKRRIYSSIDRRLRDTIRRLADISHVPVIIATIPGMSLIAYLPAVWYRLLPLQPILDKAVVEINLRIRGLNRSNGYTIPVGHCMAVPP